MNKYALALSLSVLLTACSQEQNEPETPLATAPDSISAPTAEQSTESAPTATGGDNWWDALPHPGWAQFEKVTTPTPWFDVYKIRKDIYAIHEPQHWDQVISYLIVGQSAALLFDSGMGISNIAGVAKYLTKKPLLLLNSHHHFDHVGGNYQFDLIIGLNHEFSKQASAGFSNEEVGDYVLGDAIYGATPPLFDRNTYAIKPYEFSRWVNDGQVLELGGVDLEVIHTPGHSPDGISLLDRKRRILFTGDLFYPGPLYAQLPESNLDDYLDSATRLAQYQQEVDILLTAHEFAQADASQLTALVNALENISLERAVFAPHSEGREYRFDGFSILTTEPPAWGSGEIISLPE